MIGRLFNRMLMLLAALLFALTIGVLITAAFFDDLPCGTDTGCNCSDNCLDTPCTTTSWPRWRSPWPGRR